MRSGEGSVEWQCATLGESADENPVWRDPSLDFIFNQAVNRRSSPLDAFSIFSGMQIQSFQIKPVDTYFSKIAESVDKLCSYGTNQAGIRKPELSVTGIVGLEENKAEKVKTLEKLP